MKMSDAFPSKYLKASDIEDSPRNVKISHVDIEPIGKDQTEKPVIYWIGNSIKPVVLNRINTKTLVSVYGDDSDEWQGQPVILYHATVEMAGEMVSAIRMRIPKAPPKHSPNKIESGPSKKPTPRHSDEAETENPAPADADEF
jgi:hypothetical protein